MDGLTTAAIISEDPHAVLVEFSSVVADTQEYIIKVRATGEQVWQVKRKWNSSCAFVYLLGL